MRRRFISSSSAARSSTDRLCPTPNAPSKSASSMAAMPWLRLGVSVGSCWLLPLLLLLMVLRL